MRAFANFVRCDLLFIRMCLDDAFLLGGNRGPSTNILGATGTTKDHFGGIMYVCMYVSFKKSQLELEQPIPESIFLGEHNRLIN